MIETVCKYCGHVMYDNESSIRFKCNKCGEFFDYREWAPKLRQQLKEALPSKEEKK